MPTFKIELVTGSERAKVRTTVAVTSAYPSAIAALYALVTPPPGWIIYNLTPTYATYAKPGFPHCHTDEYVSQPPPKPTTFLG